VINTYKDDPISGMRSSGTGKSIQSGDYYTENKQEPLDLNNKKWDYHAVRFCGFPKSFTKRLLRMGFKGSLSL